MLTLVDTRGERVGGTTRDMDVDDLDEEGDNEPE